MPDTISIVVVDDHPLFRAGVTRSLELDGSIKVVGEGGSAEEACALTRRLCPDIILLDISMPGNGISAAREIAGLEQRPRVVMLTVSEDDDNIMAALEAGAVGYVLKGIEATHLIAAVRSVAAGDTFVSPNLTLRLISGIRGKAKPAPLECLTSQEKKTLQLVAKGMSNREAGEILGVHEKTIKFHMSKVLAKLNVRNRVEASMLAQKEWGDRN